MLDLWNFINIELHVPLTCFVVCIFLGLEAIKNSDICRRLLFVPFTISNGIAFSRLQDLTTNAGHTSVVGLFLLIWQAHMICFLLIDDLALPSSQSPSSWCEAYKVLFNGRRLGLKGKTPSTALRNAGTDGASHALQREQQLGVTLITSQTFSKSSKSRMGFCFVRCLSAAAIYIID